MAINFDSIQPVSSATVTASRNNNGLIRIEFARGVDQDVLKDMQALEAQPFARFAWLSANEKTVDVIVNSNYSLQAVAEAIAQKLEGHEMTIQRLVGLFEKDKVSSFAAQ